MLDVPVALALPHSREAQVELLDVLVLADGLPIAVEHDPAVLHHVRVVGEAEGDGRVLLGEEHGHALLVVQAAHDLEDLLHEHGGEAHGRLVQEHELGVGHEGPPDGHHLLLASGDVARPDSAPLAEAREVLVHPLEIPLERVSVTRVGARQEVLLHGQVLEDVPAFHHLHDAAPDDLRRVFSLDGLPEKLDAALAHVSPLRPQQSRDGLEGGALAGPVGPEEGDDASLGDGERHPLQHEDDVIIDHLDVVDREQRRSRVAHGFLISFSALFPVPIVAPREVSSLLLCRRGP